MTNSNPLANALSAVAYGRLDRSDATVRRQTAYDNRQEFALSYAGYANGSHQGRLPNGGTVPVQPKSNGSIQRGQVFAAQVGGGNKLFGTWMPR